MYIWLSIWHFFKWQRLHWFILKMIGTDIVIRSFFIKTMTWHEGQGNAPVSVSQRWFRKLLGVLKIWLFGEVCKPKLSMFSKNYVPVPQSTHFVIAPIISSRLLTFLDTLKFKTLTHPQMDSSTNSCSIYLFDKICSK